MSNQRGSSALGSAQDVGGAENGVLRERIRASAVQTADGSRVMLSVVAVDARSGKTAERIIEQVFQTVSGSQANNLAYALRRGLEIASQGVARQGAEATAAAVAVRKSRVFFASVGDNVIFRIAGREAIRLTQPSNSRLDIADAPRVHAGPEAGLTLQTGDRLVLTSPGLLESSPADGKPFVDPNSIPEHIRNLPPEDAAKHLVSIALGRDVGGNVTVAVLGEAKEPRRFPVVALAVAAIGIVLLVLGAMALLNPSDTNTVTDFGFAVLVRGGVLADRGEGVPNLVGNLDTIPAGAELTAQTDAVLGLQSTHEASSQLARGNVYLEQGADLTLSQIDARSDQGGSGKSQFDLSEGSILLSRQSGTWEYRIHALTDIAIMSGAGPAAMGVETRGGSTQLDCLIGICRYVSPTGEELLLSGGDSVLVGASSGIAQESHIPADTLARWDALCGGCVQGNP